MRLEGAGRSLPSVVALVGGVILVATGLWAFLAPESFYEQVAEYPPYNEHFLHDIGAFLVGLGAALLVAVVITDALLLALFANAVGAVLHAVSHIQDRDLGGAASDPWLHSAVAAVLVAATIVRRRRSR